MCVIYKKFNEIIIKNRYTLFLIQEIQDRIYRIEYFTYLDFREAYYKVYIKKEEKWKIAFGIRLGYFEYLIMPFELINALATFQALINDIFKDFLD